MGQLSPLAALDVAEGRTEGKGKGGGRKESYLSLTNPEYLNFLIGFPVNPSFGGVSRFAGGKGKGEEKKRGGAAGPQPLIAFALYARIGEPRGRPKSRIDPSHSLCRNFTRRGGEERRKRKIYFYPICLSFLYTPLKRKPLCSKKGGGSLPGGRRRRGERARKKGKGSFLYCMSLAVSALHGYRLGGVERILCACRRRKKKGGKGKSTSILCTFSQPREERGGGSLSHQHLLLGKDRDSRLTELH